MKDRVANARPFVFNAYAQQESLGSFLISYRVDNRGTYEEQSPWNESNSITA